MGKGIGRIDSLDRKIRVINRIDETIDGTIIWENVIGIDDQWTNITRD